MKESKVTINILNWLENNGWKIISYDFPQSGTGILLHPNSEENKHSKNKGGIIPDILATRNGIAVFLENKDRFVLSDFEKIKEIKCLGNYSNGLTTVLANYNINSIYYGIGIPAVDKYIDKSLENKDDIDIIICTNENGEVQVIHDIMEIFP